MRNFKIFSFLFSVILLLSLTVIPNKVEAQLFQCKVEIVDCPGWFTGDRQLCHQFGSGVQCLCGTSTLCRKSEGIP